MNYKKLINKDNLLDKNYVPENLIILDDNENNFHKYVDASLKPTLIKEVYEYFVLLQNDALKDNFHFIVDSGYRSYEYQKKIWDSNIMEHGLEQTKLSVAIPGASEHQSGLAIDIGVFDKCFRDELTIEEINWLINNSYKYGFILRYPSDKVGITHIKYEPWHYRFVGIELAKYLFKNKLTLEEYYKK